MTRFQVTLSAKSGKPRITYRDVDAEDDATAAEVALGEVGKQDWLVGFVSEMKNTGPASELAARMERKSEQRLDLFTGVM